MNNNARSEPTAAAAAAPVLSSVVPPSGPAAGNNNVTLNGSGFSGVTAVSFGSQPALGYIVNSSIRITAVAPAGSGSVPVTVTTPGGTSNPLTYTYAALPTLLSLAPWQGPSSGGTSVVLTGAGFSGATAVSFGASPAAGFSVDSATQITAVAPAGTGSVPVTVTTPSGTSNPVYFFYINAPVLVLAVPPQGPSSGGTSVVLTGAGLSGATAVSFGASPAAGFSVDSATQITAVAPAGTGSVPVTVTTPGGTSNPVVYTYVTAPVITSLSPALGPVSSGTSVTITGTGLTTTTAVNFGAVPAPFTVLSDTSLVALAPAGPAGPVPVSVTTLGGTSGSLTYTRTAPPVI